MPALALLGMHRSYTSLAARWLSQCGLALGSQTLGSGVGNTDGHFEDLDFYHFHLEILRAQGLPSNGMVDIAQPAFAAEAFNNLQISVAFAERGSNLLACKGADGQAFGWKEPRTCLFLPFYRANADLHSLVLFRPYRQVVASLVSRELHFLQQRKFVGWRKPLFWLQRNALAERVQNLRRGFLAAWIHYNQCLLDHIDASDQTRIMVHDLASLVARDHAVIAGLNDWGFACQHQPLSELVRPESSRDDLLLDRDQAARADVISARFLDLIGQHA